ncbi:MAG: response regulator [Treponema sp.]|jgi:PAS domain S-box-containing protein|nr:response regulator [Treponema sp.]
MGAKKPYSILAVDDEGANLIVLNRILSPEYSLYTAKSGTVALRLAGENRPDLILLDILMPDINGFEVLAALKENPSTQDIPVIIITGLDNADDEETGFSLGAADYITKPFKPVVVRARVKTQIKNAALMHMLADDLVRLSSIAEGSPQLMFYLSTDGKIEYMNPAATELSGYTEKELFEEGLALLLGRDNLRRLHEEYLPGLSGSSASGEKSLSFEMTVTWKDGGIRLFSFSAFAAVLHNGETGVGITARDDTELKRMQQELVAAKEQAEYYNKAKSDFLSRMSHEMRTPMNAIMGMTAIARTAEDGSRRIHCLDSIDESSRHLLGLIDNILDMAKIDSGNFDLVPRKFSFSRAAAQVSGGIASMAGEKKQDFTFQIDPAIPDSLIADEGRLQQILLNLLSNAVKFTPERGNIHFSAVLLEKSNADCVIRFEVTDSGPGISAELRERLWDAFEQLDNSIARAQGGTGLGLAITKRIVEMMGGSIEVDSEPGRGARFICTVRLRIDGGASGAGRGADGASALAGKRILVADDVEINREIIFSLMEDSGAVFEGAGDGKEALEMFSKNRYDLVLMDLHMPGMDGFESSRRIRASALPGAATIPIIAVTADAGSDVVSRCLEAGMNGHIRKPLDKDLLIDTIARNLSGKT